MSGIDYKTEELKIPTDEKVDLEEVEDTYVPNGIKSSTWMHVVWKSYKKFENISNKTIKQFDKRGITNPKVKWAVTEKVHGANLTILYNGKEFGAAKRNSLLGNKSTFFPGWKDVVEKEKVNIIKAYNLLKQKDNTIDIIMVYGELFGGLYMHKNKKYRSNLGTTQIQPNIYYSPSLHFYAFDIKIRQNGAIMQLEFQKALQIFKTCGFLYCCPLFIGCFDECKIFDVENFETTIPSKLGLPQICDFDNKIYTNFAEGVVLRKLKGNHGYLKLKCKAFMEIKSKKKKGNNKKRKRNNKKQITTEIYESVRRRKELKKLEKILLNYDNNVTLNWLNEPNTIKNFGVFEYDIDENIFDLINRCINNNRYETVMSKIGVLSLDNINNAIVMMRNDVFEELMNEKNDELDVMQKQEKKVVKRYIKYAVEIFFKPKQLNLSKNNDK
eukprot:322624_1